MNKPKSAEERMTWCESWDAGDHDAKMGICTTHNISYDTARHWRSEFAGVKKPPSRKGVKKAVTAPSISGWEPGVLNVPLDVDLGKESATIAFLADTHNPYQDDEAMRLVEHFLKDHPPKFIVYGGDVNDFYFLSNFDKNPRRIDKLQEDLNNTRTMFERHRKILPNAQFYLLEGNHEARLQKFMWTRAPQLSSLKCLELPELLGLPEYDIKYISYEQGLMVNDVFLMLHGDLVSKHSGWTAKMMFEKHGGNGISGHSHRGGSFFKRDRFGTHGWWEGFCLCSLNPDWIKNPNWVQGFSLIHFNDNHFWLEQVPIVNHRFIYGGEIYE